MLQREYLTVGNVDEARRAVLVAVDAGADVIKIVVDVGPKLLSLEEVKAIVDEAHKAKVKVAAHATTAEGSRIAAEAGVDSIEHATDASDETFKLMARRGIFLVPTDFTADSLRQIFAADLERNPKEKEDFEKYIADYSAKVPKRLQRALKAGVRIAAGSDVFFMYPGKTRGQASLLVLETLHDEGMMPIDCIRAATTNAAELLGWQDRLGAIEAGKLADIIALERDPLKDLSEFQRVRFVMKSGYVIKDELTGR
jgi:imidazolonepropionase-like amidohydrolase